MRHVRRPLLVLFLWIPLAISTGSSHPAAGAPPADTGTVKPVQIEAKGWAVSSMILAPNGKMMVSAECKRTDGGKFDAELVYRELPTGKEYRRLQLPDGCPSNMFYHTDGKTIVLGHRSGIDLVDAAGRIREVVRRPDDGLLPLALSPDGKTLVGLTWKSPRKAFAWDITTGKQLHEFVFPEPPQPNRRLPPPWTPRFSGEGPTTGFFNFCAFSEEGDTLITEGPTYVELWDVASWKLLGPAGDHGIAAADGLRLGGNYTYDGVDLRHPRWLEHNKPCHAFGTENADLRIRTVPGGRRLLLPCYRNPPLRVVPHKDGSIILECRQTHTELHRFRDFQDERWRRVVKLTADGKTLVGHGFMQGSDDTSRILIWDVSGLHSAVSAKAAPSPSELTRLWGEMTRDFYHASPAMRELAANPEQTLTLLRAQLKPVDLTGAAKLLQELDSDDFGARQRAGHELEGLDVAVLPLLRRALRNNPSAEGARRLREIIQRLERTAEGKEACLYRAIDLLEYLDSLEARRILRQLAEGGQGEHAAAFAKEAIIRLGKQGARR